MARSTVNPSSAASISCPAASASPAENPQAPVPRGQIIGLPATAATGKQQTANHACPQSRRNPRNTSSRPHLTGPAPSGMNDQSIARGIRLFQAVPGSGVIPVRAVPLAAFIPSRVPGRGHGAGSRQAVRRGQSRGRTRRQSAVAGQNDRRPRGRPGGPVMLPWPVRPGVVRRAWPGSGSARRASRRRPGSGAGGRRRPWRCSWPLSRGGR
jgi:hypothetical protein